MRTRLFTQRRGAVLPMFAVLLPLMLLFCGFAINLAYVQLCSTQIKVVADAASHAGGRALGTPPENNASETMSEAKARVRSVARSIAAMNYVGNQPADVSTEAMVFGRSVRETRNDGTRGKYVFTPLNDDSNKIPSSFAVHASRSNIPLIFKPMRETAGGTAVEDFDVARGSVATQVDRDIALVLDRSGSMLYFEDEDGLEATLLRLRDETYTVVTQEAGTYYWYYKYYNGRYNYRKFKLNAQPSGWTKSRAYPDPMYEEEETEQRQKISHSEYNNATEYIYYRTYTDNVIMWLERDYNPNDTLGDSFHHSESDELTSPQAMYAYDYEYKYKNGTSAPRYSRWYYLDRGVTVFLNVLSGGTDPSGRVRYGTVQRELVSLVTFNSYPTIDYELMDDGLPEYSNNGSPGYLDIRDRVDGIVPNSGTGLGRALRTGKDRVYGNANSRTFAAKTVVMLTDGDNTSGDEPVGVAQNEINGLDLTVHTVTFTRGVSTSGKNAMQSVANYGAGRYYHTDEGAELERIFEEIANNLPTTLTY